MNLCKLSMFLVLFLTACNLPGGVGNSLGSGPLAWMDAPLDGSIHPLGILEVVAHASDLSGITEIEFSADGQVLLSGAPLEGVGNELLTFRTVWEAASPGVHTLLFRGLNSNGIWSNYAQAQVTIIGEDESIDPTATGEASPTPTYEPSGTTLPTETHTATPTLTSLPPTATPTSPPPTSTQIPPTTTSPPDTQFPSVSILHSPLAPFDKDLITFTATGSDDIGVVRIEIWVAPPGQSSQLVKTCLDTTICEFTGGPYTFGTLTYLAKVWDAVGNSGGSWPQGIEIAPFIG